MQAWQSSVGNQWALVHKDPFLMPYEIILISGYELSLLYENYLTRFWSTIPTSVSLF